jgi:hypothetical protein
MSFVVPLLKRRRLMGVQEAKAQLALYYTNGDRILLRTDRNDTHTATKTGTHQTLIRNFSTAIVSLKIDVSSPPGAHKLKTVPSENI